MKIVYVVEINDLKSSWIKRIYATKENAEKFAAEYNNKEDRDMFEIARVYEWEVHQA